MVRAVRACSLTLQQQGPSSMWSIAAARVTEMKHDTQSRKIWIPTLRVMNVRKLNDLIQQEESVRAQPYPSALVKVRLVKLGHTAKYMQNNGKDGTMLNFSVADATDAVLAMLNDVSQFSSVKEGRTLHVRNFLMKGGRLVLTEHSKIMQGPSMEVPEKILDKARNIISPSSPVKTVREVTELPQRQIVTIQGEIVKDEAVKTVKVGQKDTSVRTIAVQVEGHLIDVSLWRQLTENPIIKLGEYVEISHCVHQSGRKKLS